MRDPRLAVLQQNEISALVLTLSSSAILDIPLQVRSGYLLL
jgi:hypothetical protein